MTKEEINKLNTFLGEWSEYKRNDLEHKAFVINELTALRHKLDIEQENDSKRFKQIDDVLTGDHEKEGVISRIKRLERFNKQAIKIVGGLFLAIGSLLSGFVEWVWKTLF